MPRIPDPLAHARAAYARRDWADALHALQAADRETPLADADLECLFWSAAMLDLDGTALPACERLFASELAAGHDERAAFWAFMLGFRLLALREMGRATGWLQRAQRLLDALGRPCAVTGYLLIPTIHRHLMVGEDALAAQVAAQAVAIGERHHEPDLAAFAKCLLGRALVRQGQVEPGIAQLDEAMLIALSDTMSPIFTGLVYCSLIASCRQVFAFDRSREWTDALSQWCGAQPQLVQFNGLCQMHRAEIMEMNGAWHDALIEARRARRSLARAVAAETEAAVAYQEAEIYRLRGEFAAAEARYRVASRLGRDPQPGLSLLRLAQGRTDDAAAAVRRALAAITEPLARARLLPAAVEILLAAHAIDEARVACDELQHIAQRFNTDILAAMVDQARGDVDLATGCAAAALPRYRAAFAAWHGTGAPYIEARLRLRVAQACRALGDEDGARLELEAARTGFEQLGAAPDLAQVTAAMAVGATRSSGRLSPREHEVLRLIAAGHSNKRIANELGLSAKTVDRHVSNIFDKLQVSSRAAATAFAFQHRLL